MTKLQQLVDLGQSIWLDYIRRSFIASGDLKDLIGDGLRGVTSNPSIFEKAIAGSTDYDQALQDLAREGKSVEEIYEALVVEDIQRAADLLRPVYARTEGADGYVSLEVSPELARDTQGTIAEARHLFSVLDRPNVMIKVPATPAGIPAIEALIAEGINVNVTLIFSVDQYQAVAQAYLRGLEQRVANGEDLTAVASVASLFISRVDVAVDRELEAIGTSEALGLRGKIALANGKQAYAHFRDIFAGERWERLADQGARVQRVLWASTSTKDPTYPDTLYVDNLVGPQTVNTLPPATLRAFRDHGTVSPTLEAGLEEARIELAALAKVGIDLHAITEELQDEGVDKFAHSFRGLIDAITDKRDRLLARWQRRTAALGPYQGTVSTALEQMARDRVLRRIWAHDHTVWKPEPTEITNRLGWLHTASAMVENLGRLEDLARDVREAGYTHALLLGMGGSSLAPEVFRETFGVKEGYLDLAVLDSTDPGAVRAHARRLDPERTLFIVASKSGGTAETLSFFKFFFNWMSDAVGQDRAGDHFVAITDPDSHLVDLAARHGFRATFLNDPHIGGRYSALSYFGLVPAALVGVDLERLLSGALTAQSGCESCVRTGDNHGAWLGAVLGELAKAGRDKATFVISKPVAHFGDWVEQLIAESTGKEGTGILPVIGEPLGSPEVYGDDRLFIHLRLSDDESQDAALADLEAHGHPLVRFNLRDPYDLGHQIFLWEMAVAVAGYRLGIHPFNQPNVEAAKVQARRMVEEYEETGQLPEGESAPLTPEALIEFLGQAQPGGYIALQAYVQPTTETDAALLALRTRLRDRYHLATTVGYGPRFLHSTGQLHKGDAGNGLFIQFTADSPPDVPIPEEAGSPESSITFGVLKLAQALGDRQALLDAGRRVIRFHLGQDVVPGLTRLREVLD